MAMTNGASHPAATTSKDQNPLLLSYDQIPEWCRDNRYIRHGYRPVSGSSRVSFASWFHMHNETLNIYTHMLPAMAFLGSQWYLLDYLHSRYEDITPTDSFIFSFFLLMAAVCLGLSTTYHTLLNHSLEVEAVFLRLDFSGIILLTIGDFVSGIYMAFWCEPTLRKIYWTMILTLGSITIFILVNSRFQGKKWRSFRVLTMVATGLSGFAPLTHGIVIFGLPQMMKQSGMPYYLAEGAMLILGALIYATRFPERLSPGTFDIYGSSHQIFHVLVVLATVTQLMGILSAFDYNYHHRVCSSG
ncbi:hypothetical protein ACJ41O_000672 [Fusarium nematophilum]